MAQNCKEIGGVGTREISQCKNEDMGLNLNTHVKSYVW